MCGIVGYLGKKDAYPILINGLKRLEYRGYDSSGIALYNGDLQMYKCKGKVQDLENLIGKKSKPSNLGIGHTRWATHGEPNDVNAHPHISNNGDLVLVHNGIIENCDSLKQFLFDKNYTFKSDTDTEILVNFIEYVQKEEKVSLDQAVRLALTEVVGAYAIAVISKKEPEFMVSARLGSPLVLGLGNGEFFIGSDATPFIDLTKKVIYLEDGEMAIISTSGISIRTIESDQPVDAVIHKLKMDLDSIEKGGYDHFMLKEIFEQPTSILNTIRGRLFENNAQIRMAGLNAISDKLEKANRILIIGCGTSWHAGLVGEYIIEDLARIPVEVEYASEFRYRNPIINSDDVVIAISQSGETADTLAAIKMAKEAGACVFGICNVVGSSIARESIAGAFTHAGPEIGVASTKAFTAQVTVLTMIALYLGRGSSFPVALEGALKLKEISYIHAEAYPSGELKHGPLALVDEDMPVVTVAPNNELLDKLKSNLHEVRARGGELFVFADCNASFKSELGITVIDMPPIPKSLEAIVYTLPLQLLSYHVAVLKGTDVDQPRNLAKSVTVE